MKIRVGKIFRYQRESKEQLPSDYPDFYSLTKGKYGTGVGTGGRGIFHYKKVREPKKDFMRIPSIILHSNPFKEGTEDTPWVDIINADEGYAIYNGDNKSSKQDAFSSFGNKIIIESLPLFSSASQRLYAPPIVLFRQELIAGKRKGYRSFQGYGVPVKATVRTQREKGSTVYFTNLVFEIALLSLDAENDTFSWDWIDARRNPDFSSEKALDYAPSAWKEWVKKGNSKIENLRRRVIKRKILTEKIQKNYSKDEINILNRIHEFYSEKKTKHHFEGLASAVAVKVTGGRILKGWVTKRSADEGIDFVNRLELGDGFGKTSIVVLGQAKCISPSSSISGLDLARLAARLQRGWIGVFVTTGCFSQKCQKELIEDKYPIILVNGKRLAKEIKLMMNEDNIPLAELLVRHSEWYEKNMKPLSASRIIDWEFSKEVWPI